MVSICIRDNYYIWLIRNIVLAIAVKMILVLLMIDCAVTVPTTEELRVRNYDLEFFINI